GDGGGLAARYPDRVAGPCLGKAPVDHERKAAARGLDAGRHGQHIDLEPGPVEHFIGPTHVEPVGAVIGGNSDDHVRLPSARPQHPGSSRLSSILFSHRKALPVEVPLASGPSSPGRIALLSRPARSRRLTAAKSSTRGATAAFVVVDWGT